MGAAAKKDPPNLGPRLPFPAQWGQDFGIDLRTWTVAVNSRWPNAKSVEGVANALLMALEMANGDKNEFLSLLRGIHVMPTYKGGQEAEMPFLGIDYWRSIACKHGLAGMDAPVYGPEQTKTFKGRVKSWKNNKEVWEDVQVTVTYPLWVELTGYRIVGGARVPTTARVQWAEAYGRRGGKTSELPNEMWANNPYRMLEKVCESLLHRKMFGSNIGYSAEEMAGKEVAEVTVRTNVANDVKGPVAGKGAARTEARGQSGSGSPSKTDPETGESLETGETGADLVQVLPLTREWVAKIIDRASKANQWQAAREVFREKLEKKFPNDYRYAVQAIDHAERFKDIPEPIRKATALVISRSMGLVDKASTPEDILRVWEQAKGYVLGQKISEAEKTFAVLEIDRARALHESLQAQQSDQSGHAGQTA